jgi:acetoin utilization transport system permease protein
MTFKDKFRFVRKNMKKNRSRIFMTVLATAMGCTFLIVLASVAFGLQKSIIKEATSDRVVTEITVYGKEIDGNMNNSFTEEDIAYLKTVNHVKAVSYKHLLEQPVLIRADDMQAGGQVFAVDFTEETKAGLTLSDGHLPKSANEVVVGYNFRDIYGMSAPNTSKPAKEWIGKTIELEVKQNFDGTEKTQVFPVTIVGVSKEPTREFRKDMTMFIGQETLKNIENFTLTQFGAIHPPKGSDANGQPAIKKNTDPRTYNELIVVADTLQHVKGIGEEIRTKSYINHSVASELKQINMIFLIFKIGLIFVGTIAVIIASIGIYNTMSMAVTERAQDIGIMKAIGAHPKTIKGIFLIESSYIGILGAIIGTVVSYVISLAVNILLPIVVKSLMNSNIPKGFEFTYIPWYLTVICVAISVGVALLSGSRPAQRATRVDVLKALRRDI